MYLWVTARYGVVVMRRWDVKIVLGMKIAQSGGGKPGAMENAAGRAIMNVLKLTKMIVSVFNMAYGVFIKNVRAYLHVFTVTNYAMVVSTAYWEMMKKLM